MQISFLTNVEGVLVERAMRYYQPFTATCSIVYAAEELVQEMESHFDSKVGMPMGKDRRLFNEIRNIKLKVNLLLKHIIIKSLLL
jgi:hypothetical protein